MSLRQAERNSGPEAVICSILISIDVSLLFILSDPYPDNETERNTVPWYRICSIIFFFAAINKGATTKTTQKA